MKRFLLPALLIYLLQPIYSQDIEPNSSWIVGETRILTKMYVYTNPGMIVTFKGDSIEFSHVLDDTIITEPFLKKNQRLYVDEDRWGRIKYRDSDSIVMNYDRTAQIKLQRISPNPEMEIPQDFWQHLEWMMCTDNDTTNINLTTINFVPFEKSKICMIERHSQNLHYYYHEKWRLKNVNSAQVLAISIGQMELNLYYIEKYSKDTVFMTTLQDCCSTPVKLVKKQPADQNTLDSIKDLLINRNYSNWTYLDYSGYYTEERSLPEGCIGMGGIRPNKQVFDLGLLFDNKLKLTFNPDNTYQIEDGVLTKEGRWKLSGSGQQIILDEGINTHDYIDIIELTGDNIIVGKVGRFRLIERKDMFGDFYFRLKCTR